MIETKDSVQWESFEVLDEAEIAANHSIDLMFNATEAIRKKVYTGASLSHCEECGEEIPEARRLALKGVKKCVLCQEDAERAERGL
jgi:phage/conjugal plasmid C-4 type zinc finger TraR family protein